MPFEVSTESVASAPFAPLTIISLDQNALSSMEPRAGTAVPVWSEIKSLLVAGVDSGKFICPVPWETVLESTPLPSERYSRLRAFQGHLSRGTSFKPFMRVLAEEVLALVRPAPDVPSIVPLGWDEISALIGASAPGMSFSEFKQNTRKELLARVTNYTNCDMSLADLENEFRLQISGDLFCCIESLHRGGPLVSRFAYSRAVCKFLRLKRVSVAEIDKIKELISLHKYETIPVLSYYIRLLTQFEFDLLRGGRRQEPNDIEDLSRMASALWSANIYVCDKEMAEVCQKIRMHDLTGVRVFSASRPGELLEHLRALYCKP